MAKKVLVVGGGIAGTQAALQLAEYGFKVTLLDKDFAIGGTMSKLDKTFPTNDCSMCILSPKLVEAGRHKNIQLLTYAEVKGARKENGRFKVKILKKARYVDTEKCKGCGDCQEACTVLLPDYYNENLCERTAIFRLYDQAVPSAFGITKLGESPCRAACPIHVNAHGYIALIRNKKYKEALELVREKNPFPLITGRICTHPCEDSCTRGRFDEPVAIDLLKRFVADLELNEKGEIPVPEIESEKDKEVAIVGAGPAGLMCAYKLRKKGYRVTVYERHERPGGMLYVGIPSYRLPRDILFRELEILEKMGVEFKYGVEVGKDISFKELYTRYDAVFVGVGAHRSKRLNIKGKELKGIIGAVEFLRTVNLGGRVEIGEKVAVVGGGNAAMDAARVARRLGKDVTILYRRTKKEMPANKEEILEAEEEGIKFVFLVNPVEYIGNGKVEKVKLIRMRLGDPDESGRRRPVPIEGSEFVMEFDTVIEAVSQKPELDPFYELEKTGWGTVKVDPLTLRTNIENVFAGGDCVTGPLTFIDAMYHGKEAAESIMRMFEGKDLKENREEGSKKVRVEYDFSKEKPLERRRPAHLDPSERIKHFKEVVKGFSEEDALYESSRCLNCVGCSECMECVKACEPGAIFHDMRDEIIEEEYDAVIVAPGFDEFEPEIKKEYGFGRFKNVITSIQFERILSASGPTKGEITRPGDGKHAEKIAFLQCVGSRDVKINHDYCSSVCCMYAIKEAVIAKEHDQNVEPHIFFMDMRTYGKDFEKYYERAKDVVGVKFHRARVAKVEEATDGDLLVYYEDEDGTLHRERFDMVVLSVGMEPSHGTKGLAEIFSIGLNKYGFAERETFDPLATRTKGVYVAGAFSAPKDIPETVAEALGAAGYVMEMLKDGREREEEEARVEEKVVIGEEPRVGVFVCHCGRNIGGYIDVHEVVEYVKTLDNVVYAEENLYTCSQDTQERMKEIIKKYNLNRVVVASCTPRTHEPLFRKTIEEAGINKYLFEMSNIRDQDSWVHMQTRKQATEKAKDLIRMAVWKVIRKQPLKEQKIPVNPDALVIGGGIAGLVAAKSLSEMGHRVYLLERSNILGGNARKIKEGVFGEDVAGYLEKLISDVEKDKNIEIIKGAEIEKVEGFVGNYYTYLKGREKPIQHGGVIIATGAKEYEPEEYLYKSDDRVITQKELEDMMEKGVEGEKTFVMIQCVGSRNDEHPYCSRTCCSHALHNAIKLKNMGHEVFVLYRDIRTYGFRESLYTEARRKGVVFIRYERGNEPVVENENNSLYVYVDDPILKKKLRIPADHVVLSVGIVPDVENNEKLAKFYKVPLNEDGFFLEAHMKLRPVDFATEGVFLCGLAHAPKFIDESIVQAKAAAARCATLLSLPYITTQGEVAKVDERKCIGCGLCVDVCPYAAISMKEKKVLGERKLVAEVNPVLCKGCGACTASCRPGAIDLLGYSNSEVLSSEFALFVEDRRWDKEKEKILELLEA